MMVLLAEDDVRLGALIVEYLSSHGYSIVWETDGLKAIERAKQIHISLAILDLMLPGADGMTVCREIRSYVPAILMLTAVKSTSAHIDGLEGGADDYLVKPIEPAILLAHIRSLLRRNTGTSGASGTSGVTESPSASAASSERENDLEGSLVTSIPTSVPTSLGGLDTVAIQIEGKAVLLDRRMREARVDGTNPIDLTAVEFSILWLLAQNSDVVSRDMLYEQVLGIPYNGLDRGIDIHISRMRRKMLDSGLSANALRAVRGSGYQLVRA